MVFLNLTGWGDPRAVHRIHTLFSSFQLLSQSAGDRQESKKWPLRRPITWYIRVLMEVQVQHLTPSFTATGGGIL